MSIPVSFHHRRVVSFKFPPDPHTVVASWSEDLYVAGGPMTMDN